MKQRSSKKSKRVHSHKFYDAEGDLQDEGFRYFAWPREVFIELRLSKKQIEKVQGWKKDGHSFMPLWFANLSRVLIVDQEGFEEWLLRKEKR